MHSVIQGALIPGGQDVKMDRQSVFFTAVNPMYANQDLEEVQDDLDKPRITVFKKYLEIPLKYSALVQSEARSKKRISVLSNTVARNRSFQHTICDLDCKKWYARRLMRICIAKYINPQGYRA